MQKAHDKKSNRETSKTAIPTKKRKTRISSKVASTEILEIKRAQARIASIPADGRWVAVVRIRGRVNVPRDIEYTLKLLRLHKPNHAVVVPLTESYKGMLLKVMNRVAWGEITFETFLELLKRRGRVIGDKPLTDEIVAKYSNNKWKTVEELAKALWNKEVKFKDIPWLKPVFRLHPPRGGYRGGIKKPFELGGAYGYWGTRINELLHQMM